MKKNLNLEWLKSLSELEKAIVNENKHSINLSNKMSNVKKTEREDL